MLYNDIPTAMCSRVNIKNKICSYASIKTCSNKDSHAHIYSKVVVFFSVRPPRIDNNPSWFGH